MLQDQADALAEAAKAKGADRGMFGQKEETVEEKLAELEALQTQWCPRLRAFVVQTP